MRAPLEEVRRLVARIGASATAHRTPPVRATTRAAGAPHVAIAGVPAPGADARPPHRLAALRAIARSADPIATAPVDADVALSSGAARGLAGPIVACAGAVPCRLGTDAAAGALLRPSVPRRGAMAPGGRLYRQRRGRVPWHLLPRERLRAAWTRLLRDHGAPPDELRLLGVFGPVALGAVEGVVLRPDGRAELRLVRRRAAGPAGDVALARHVPSGRLMRSDVPAPAGARRSRSLR